MLLRPGSVGDGGAEEPEEHEQLRAGTAGRGRDVDGLGRYPCYVCANTAPLYEMPGYTITAPLYTRYMYNDDPLRQPGPHTRSYTPKRWQEPHTRTHTLESDKGHTHTLLHSRTGGAGWISLRGWVVAGCGRSRSR